MRPYLKIKERKKRKILEETFEVIKKSSYKNRKKTNYNSCKIIFNIALYFLIAERDIQSVKIDALTHPDPWKRNLCIRTILLTLHEWVIDKVSGNTLKVTLDEINAPEELKEETYIALRKIRKAQKAAKRKLGFLRNSTIAHRDPDALLQYRTIRNLDDLSVLKLASEFYAGADLFIDLVSKLILESSSLQGLFTQLLNSRK
ncbi:hypothetical protein [Thiolinea disciformis]|uniref:hypothetical protein n=1 Tax=Thiolinea disciformis TaxID=125614 RepID=UPI00036EFC83|nr:hypothetical protein [Thiolinea disciformis]